VAAGLGREADLELTKGSVLGELTNADEDVSWRQLWPFVAGVGHTDYFEEIWIACSSCVAPGSPPRVVTSGNLAT
jgi:hypothetical protein